MEKNEVSFRVKGREAKLAGREKTRKNPMNGVSFRRVLIELGAKAQKEANRKGR